MSSLEHRRDMPRRRFDHTKRTPLLGWAVIGVTIVFSLGVWIWAVIEFVGRGG